MLDNSIMVDVEAIHSILTKNFTLYSPEALKESVTRWTQPVSYTHLTLPTIA